MRPTCLRACRQLFSVSPTRSFTSNVCLRRAYQEGDIVLLRNKKDTNKDGILIRLDASKTTGTHRGTIAHAKIIGKHARQAVDSSKGNAFRIYEPTLAEYVRLTPRMVTPIYPADANLIVSLLDIHVDTPSSVSRTEPPLEILEAGTGHGALTIHLSRAIHAANPPIPRTTSSYASSQEDESEDAIYLGESISDLQDDALQSWKSDRRAIIHTLDISSKHSKHAKKIVDGFRHGIYAGNIDYHVGDVSDWIAQQKATRKSEEPFLSHVFLDLPNADQHLANVAPALHANGLLAVFNPSITQITECVDTIRREYLPYVLDQVIELGASTIREWDVRQVKPRATLRMSPGSESVDTTSDDETTDPNKSDEVKSEEVRDEELATDLAKQDEKYAMVCRPKVGHQVVGGGFLGLWRRMDKTLPRDQ